MKANFLKRFTKYGKTTKIKTYKILLNNINRSLFLEN